MTKGQKLAHHVRCEAERLGAIAEEIDGPHSRTVARIAVELASEADAIDREHERRVRNCRRETKRAFGNYIRTVTEEYERNRKRRRGDWERKQEAQGGENS